VASVQTYSIPPPTIYFLRPEHLDALAASILAHARNASLLYALAWRHKLAGLREGFVSKESLWDRLVFNAARARVVGPGAGTIREVVVGGGALSPPSSSILVDGRNI
jgi:long-chain acyl-CoA synthetase